MRRALALSGLFVGILALSWISLELFRVSEVIAAVWIANAVVLAFVLRWSDRAKDRLLALGVATAAMAVASLATGRGPGITAVFALSNAVEIAIGALALWRTPMPMIGPRPYILFVLGAVIAGPFVSGGLAALGMSLFGPAHATSPMIRWVVADALGMLLVGPFALAVTRPSLARTNPSALAIAAATQLMLLAASVFIFMQPATPPLFMLFPFLVLAALAHRELGGVVAVLTVAIVAITCTMLGRGPAAVAALTHFDKLTVLQLLLASTVFTVLPVTALVRKLDLQALELERQRAEAEDLNAIKTKLLAHVSHEIRSPLSGVTSMAELMRDGMMGDLNDQQRETLGQMAQNGAEVEALARDLLDAATLQSGKASVHLTDVDVEDAVETAVTGARFRAKEYGGSVVVVGAYCGEMKVAADRLRLRQILMNLMINGLKYGGRPPLVQVAAYATERGTIRFEVSDNGEGLNAEKRESLFRSFNRLGAEKSDIEGAGLGLALSRELALLQHGRIGIDDSDLGGACFWLELPQFAGDSADLALQARAAVAA
jgi:signal transduction histidine kinase